MPRRPTKQVNLSIKVEPALARLLESVENRSEFIRRAIRDRLRTACPTCGGTGLCGTELDPEPARARMQRRPCVGCGRKMNVPPSLGDLPDCDRFRLEQFFLGGPLYCDQCFREAPACGECGWHVDPGLLPVHVRSAHPALAARREGQA